MPLGRGQRPVGAQHKAARSREALTTWRLYHEEAVATQGHIERIAGQFEHAIHVVMRDGVELHEVVDPHGGLAIDADRLQVLLCTGQKLTERGAVCTVASRVDVGHVVRDHVERLLLCYRARQCCVDAVCHGFPQ